MLTSVNEFSSDRIGLFGRSFIFMAPKKRSADDEEEKGLVASKAPKVLLGPTCPHEPIYLDDIRLSPHNCIVLIRQWTQHVCACLTKAAVQVWAAFSTG